MEAFTSQLPCVRPEMVSCEVDAIVVEIYVEVAAVANKLPAVSAVEEAKLMKDFVLPETLRTVPIVVEPETASCVAAKEVEVPLVLKKLPAVKAVDEAYGNCDEATVELEKKTPVDQIEVVVAAVLVAKFEAKVNG